jgi:hypothetical protein
MKRSDAFRTAGINARRLIDFLEIEHMRKGGKHNGNLKAPQEQLEAFGIGARYIAEAIREAEQLGLVDVVRPGRRVANTYTLTWLPLQDGTPATNRWATYRAPGNQKSTPQREGSPTPQREGRCGESTPQREGRCPPESTPQREGPLKKLLTTGGTTYSEPSVGERVSAAEAAA